MIKNIVRNEKAVIQKSLQRKGERHIRISAEKMAIFKRKLGDEIQRCGALSNEYVQTLLSQLNK